MADEEKKGKGKDEQSGDEDQQNRSQTDAKGKDEKTQKPDPVPYDRFKEVNDENRTMASELKALQDEKEEREADEAKSKGKYEELYTEEKAKRVQAEKDALRKDVALEKGLPADFVKRLQGETKEDLEKDADNLLKMIDDAKKGNKGIKDSSSKKSDAEELDISNMSPKEIRENKDKLLAQ